MGLLATPAYRHPQVLRHLMLHTAPAVTQRPAHNRQRWVTRPVQWVFSSKAFRCIAPAYPAGVATLQSAPLRIEGRFSSLNQSCVTPTRPLRGRYLCGACGSGSSVVCPANCQRTQPEAMLGGPYSTQGGQLDNAPDAGKREVLANLAWRVTASRLSQRWRS